MAVIKKETSENPLSDELLREVDEELKEENAKKLLRKIAPVLCVIVFTALTVAAGFEFVKYREQQHAMINETRLVQALTLADKGKNDEAMALLADMRKNAKDDYATMAGFYQAELLLTENKTDEALKVLDEIATDEKTAEPMKNMALFSKISVAVDMPDADYVALEKELDALVEQKTSWEHKAYEIKAVIALKTKNIESAKKYLQKIIDSPLAEKGLRMRSEENLALIEKELEAK